MKSMIEILGGGGGGGISGNNQILGKYQRTHLQNP